MTKSAQSTKERLLDAAEKLLRSDGLDELSIRKVTAEAGANVAAVNYTFGDKEGLLRALLRRILRPVTEERLRRFDALQASGEVTVVELVRAYLEPLLSLHEHDGDLLFVLMLKPAQDEEEPLLQTGHRELIPGVNRFVDALVPLIPGRSWDQLQVRVGLVMGSALFFGSRLQSWLNPSQEDWREDLIAFAAAGLSA